MIKRIFETICFGSIISIPIIVLGALVSNVILGDKNTLDMTLFILGAIPIVIFLPSIFSKSRSGALHTPKVIFRKVDTLKKRGESKQSDIGGQTKIFTPFALVFAGLITWLFSFLY